METFCNQNGWGFVAHLRLISNLGEDAGRFFEGGGGGGGTHLIVPKSLPDMIIFSSGNDGIGMGGT